MYIGLQTFHSVKFNIIFLKIAGIGGELHPAKRKNKLEGRA